LKQSEFLT